MTTGPRSLILSDTRGGTYGQARSHHAQFGQPGRPRHRVLRRFEYCRDVIILVSETTGADYVAYLDERGYDHLLCGRDRVDFGLAFGLLAERYGVKRVLADSGPTLGGVLLEAGLVDEISLLVHPVFAGAEAPGLFDGLKPGLPAEGWASVKAETLAGGRVRVIWRAK